MDSKIWHDGFDEKDKPEMYIDPTTGKKWNTFALCIFWYDGWHSDLCRITEDGKFESMTDKKVYEPNHVFEYWAYVDDLIPNDLQR